jgi:hypothetical protein
MRSGRAADLFGPGLALLRRAHDALVDRLCVELAPLFKLAAKRPDFDPEEAGQRVESECVDLAVPTETDARAIMAVSPLADEVYAWDFNDLQAGAAACLTLAVARRLRVSWYLEAWGPEGGGPAAAEVQP